MLINVTAWCIDPVYTFRVQYYSGCECYRVWICHWSAFICIQILIISLLIHGSWSMHMFTHITVMHILWNMLMLYWFGNIVGDLLGRQFDLAGLSYYRTDGCVYDYIFSPECSIILLQMWFATEHPPRWWALCLLATTLSTGLYHAFIIDRWGEFVALYHPHRSTL